MPVLATTHTGVTLTLHQGFARSILIYAFLMAGWGLFLYFRGSNPSGGYLGALVLAEVLTVVQGVVGIVLYGGGHHPHSPVHYLYGVAAVLTLPTAYFMSSGGSERRDSLVLGLASLFLFGIAIRGAMTGAS